MTYPMFVEKLNKCDIYEVTEIEYEIALTLYKQDIKNKDTVKCFCEWLADYNAYDKEGFYD